MKLIASKLIIIMVYTAISMAIGYICCSGYIVFADRSFNMLDGTFPTINAPNMDTNGNNHSGYMNGTVSVVIYYWHDPKICSCYNRYFIDVVIVFRQRVIITKSYNKSGSPCYKFFWLHSLRLSSFICFQEESARTINPIRRL